jgi:glycosyltransferase involved in cell wall biosynthesis
MIDRLGLSRSVSLQHWLPSDCVPTALKSADVFVLPSLSAPYWLEQLGYVLLEAMAAGMPIAAAATGSIPWVVGDAAQLFDPFDTTSVTESLVKLALDVDTRVALASASTDRAARFDVRVVAEQIVGEVRRVC